MDRSNSCILRAENLTIRCLGRTIVNQLNLRIAKGTVNSLVGPSGMGKTTLLRSFNRLLEEDHGYQIEGRVLFYDQNIYASSLNKYELRRKIGMVFQKPTIFPASIYDNVAFGVRHLEGAAKKRYAMLVETSLRQAALWDEVKDRLNDSARNLSIGQQQRLAIARTLAVQPEILLMDEPTASLDPKATESIEKLILTLKESRTIIFVTHDLRQAHSISDQVLDLANIQSQNFGERAINGRLESSPEVQSAF